MDHPKIVTKLIRHPKDFSKDLHNMCNVKFKTLVIVHKFIKSETTD